MKTKVTIFIVLIMIIQCVSCFAAAEPDSYMEFSATGDWSIFTKDMEDKELLASVGKSKEEINEILESAGSESMIINRKTLAKIHLKVEKNESSQELWNIQSADDAYIKENLKTIVYDAFSMGAFDYQDEDVTITDYAYMKFLTVNGTVFAEEKAYGVLVGGTVVNGSAMVFTMVTENREPTEEEIKAIDEIAKSISFTVIKDKKEMSLPEEEQAEKDVFSYILGGFGALVLVIFCVYIITRIKTAGKEDEEETEEIKEEKEE